MSKKNLAVLNPYELTTLDIQNRELITQEINSLKDDNTHKLAVYSGPDGIPSGGSDGVMKYMSARVKKVFGVGVDEMHPALFPLCANCYKAVHQVMLSGMEKNLTRTAIKKNMWGTIDSFKPIVDSMKLSLQID